MNVISSFCIRRSTACHLRATRNGWHLKLYSRLPPSPPLTPPSSSVALLTIFGPWRGPFYAQHSHPTSTTQHMHVPFRTRIFKLLLHANLLQQFKHIYCGRVFLPPITSRQPPSHPPPPPTPFSQTVFHYYVAFGRICRWSYLSVA